MLCCHRVRNRTCLRIVEPTVLALSAGINVGHTAVCQCTLSMNWFEVHYDIHQASRRVEEGKSPIVAPDRHQGVEAALGDPRT